MVTINSIFLRNTASSLKVLSTESSPKKKGCGGNCIFINNTNMKDYSKDKEANHNNVLAVNKTSALIKYENLYTKRAIVALLKVKSLESSSSVGIDTCKILNQNHIVFGEPSTLHSASSNY